MRFDPFYIVSFICLVAIVSFAVEPGFARRAEERAAIDAIGADGFVLTPEDLARALSGPGMRLEPFEQDGVRAVQLRAQAPLVGDGGGAAIYFGFPPALTARWRGDEVEVSIETRSADPVPFETWAARLVLVDATASPWTQFDGAPAWETRRFRWRIPADASYAPLQLALYPSINGAGKGVDVKSVSLRLVSSGD